MEEGEMEGEETDTGSDKKWCEKMGNRKSGKEKVL